MQIWVKIVIGDDDVIGNCPFCKAENSHNIQFDDYVDYPMLWCDNCGARAVLDPKEFEMHFEKKESGKIPLLFIERAADPDMLEIKADRILTDEEMKKLTHTYDRKHQNGFDPKVIEELGLSIRPDEEIYDIPEDVMNISVPINSYNAEVPAVPHSSRVALAHDGVYVHLQVRELDGTSNIIRYWGD